MKKLFVLFFVMIAISITSNANSYSINDKDVDQMFAKAEQVSIEQISDFTTLPSPQAQLSSKNPWVAWALTFTASVGVCGIHRLYLGSSTGIFILYFCTGGGCGIIQTVDWVVLLIGALNDDIRKYENNDKVFMW